MRTATRAEKSGPWCKKCLVIRSGVVEARAVDHGGLERGAR